MFDRNRVPHLVIRVLVTQVYPPGPTLLGARIGGFAEQVRE